MQVHVQLLYPLCFFFNQKGQQVHPAHEHIHESHKIRIKRYPILTRYLSKKPSDKYLVSIQRFPKGCSQKAPDKHPVLIRYSPGGYSPDMEASTRFPKKGIGCLPGTCTIYIHCVCAAAACTWLFCAL